MIGTRAIVMHRTVRAALALVGLFVLLAACNARPAPKAPETPADDDAPAQPAERAAPAYAPGAPQPQQAQEPTPEAKANMDAPGFSAHAARTDFERAAREVEAARGDCAVACRALTSMDRAARHLCNLEGDGAECKDARDRVKAARDRVTTACGGCSGAEPLR